MIKSTIMGLTKELVLEKYNACVKLIEEIELTNNKKRRLEWRMLCMARDYYKSLFYKYGIEE